MRKFVPFLLLTVFIISCENKQSLQFTEYNFLYDKNVVVEINIPKADSASSIGVLFNEMVDDHIANSLNIEDEISNLLLPEAIDLFNKNYMVFIDEFDDESFRWEASFEGELMTQSPSLVSLAMSSYLNTGGAHGSLNISFLNFDLISGKQLASSEVIKDLKSFTKVAESHFKKEYVEGKTNSVEDYFFGKEFQLPDNLGFNEDGVVLLYNVYEIASLGDGIIEFTIPFEEIEAYLSSVTFDLL